MDVLIGIIGVIVLLYIIWQHQELKKFQIMSYEMSTEKVNDNIKIVVIADLHSFSYGEGNARLLHAVSDANPDLILIPGDLIVTSITAKYDISLQFIKQLCGLGVPIFYSNGNHESRAQLSEFEYRHIYRQYRRYLNQYGVISLNNGSCEITLKGVPIRVSGLELPLYSYDKGKKPYLEEDFIKNQLGSASNDRLQILLAHHPAFAEQYTQWGADITVCGHNHGGLVCVPGIGSIISPQFVPFPKYDAGEFTIDGRKVYISRGLGTHTFHIRICNRAELMVITIKPK